MRRLPLLLALPCLVVAGCASRPVGRTTAAKGHDPATCLDMGDMLVRQGGEVWKVLEARTVNGETRPPRKIGYLHARDYRQGRGGPVLRLYEVSTLNRNEVIGRIDSLGRVTRYEPVRNGTFDERVLPPAGRMEDNVGAIFGSSQAITLQATNERRIAFELLDKDGNSMLSPDELSGMGSRIADADANGDKQIDFAEFDRIDAL